MRSGKEVEVSSGGETGRKGATPVPASVVDQSQQRDQVLCTHLSISCISP